jgi:hypothetical protein
MKNCRFIGHKIVEKNILFQKFLNKNEHSVHKIYIKSGPLLQLLNLLSPKWRLIHDKMP